MNFDIKVISLLNAKKRRANIDEKLKSFNLNYSFIDAVDGRVMSAGEYFKYSKNPNFLFNRKHIIAPSEVGCRLSHKLAIEQFLSQSEAEWLLILEDDVTFDESLPSLLSKLDTRKFSFDTIIHLGGQQGLKCFRRVIFQSITLDKDVHLKRVNNFTLRWLLRTCGYIVNRSLARKLLRVHQESTFVADDWSFIRKKANVDCCYFIDILHHPVDLHDSAIEKERNA